VNFVVKALLPPRVRLAVEGLKTKGYIQSGTRDHDHPNLGQVRSTKRRMVTRKLCSNGELQPRASPLSILIFARGARNMVPRGRGENRHI